MEDLSDQARLTLSELTWVRGLARALVRDEATADDLAQDTWLIASKKAPTDGRPLRPWLSRVVLNLVRMRARGAKRRHLREVAASETEAGSASPEELVARVEIQRVVSGEVLALNEPYRSTVLLHFVEGLSSAEIARQLGIPDGTVRRRLKVALDQLRARLRDREDGPRGGWLAALIPFVGIEAAEAAPSAAGTATPPVKGLWVLGVAIAVVAIIAWVSKRDVETPRPAIATPIGAPAELRLPAGVPTIVPSWLVQPEVGPRRVAGHVTSDGKPVAAATVRLVISRPDASPILIGEQATRPDGAFDFGSQPAASFIISAQAPERAPGAVTVEVANPLAAADQVEIQLDPCFSRLVGTVRDASGGTIAHARLTVAGLAGVSSDDHGGYALCVQPTSYVRVDADGYGSIEIPIYLFGELRSDMVLVPEAIIVGQVVDDTSKPVANAQVAVNPEGAQRSHFGGSTTATAMTDSDGRFRITGVQPGKFRISAIVDGAATRVALPIAARSGTTSTELRLVVTTRSRLQGRIVADGAPVAGARLRLVDRQQRISRVLDPGPSSFSQTDGTFTLDGIGRGTFEVVVEPFEVRAPRSVVVDRAVVDVAIDVSRLASVRGRVTFRGKPVPNVEVRHLGADPSHYVVTDRNGAFVYEGLPPGPGPLWAMSVTTKSYGHKELSIFGSEQLTDVELELAYGARVLGTVVDEAAHPVAGAYVRLIGPDGDEGWAITDARGVFEAFSMTGGGAYQAMVFPTPAAQHPFVPARPHAPILVADGASVVTGVELAIQVQRLSLRGRIVDDQGVPIADCHVAAGGGVPAATSLDGIGFGLPSTMTASDGRFEISNLAPGRYSIAAHAADGGHAAVSGIAAGGDDIQISIPRAGTIEGDLIGFESSPLVHARVVTPGFQLGYLAIVDGDHFVMQGLPPGRFPVDALADDQLDGQLVEVRPGATTKITLRARPRVSIEGRVIAYGSGAAVAGVTCTARPAMDGIVGDLGPLPESAPTDGAGKFRLRSPTGHVRVICGVGSPTLSAAGADLEVVSMGTPALELVAVPRVHPPRSDAGFLLRPMVLPLTVLAVAPDGPAFAAGLAVDDRIIEINGESITHLLPDGAMTLLMNQPAGVPMRLSVERAGMSRMIELVPREFGGPR